MKLIENNEICMTYFSYSIQLKANNRKWFSFILSFYDAVEMKRNSINNYWKGKNFVTAFVNTYDNSFIHLEYI